MYHRRRGNGAALLPWDNFMCYRKRYNDYIIQRIFFFILGLFIVVFAHPVITTFYVAAWGVYFCLKWLTKRNKALEEKSIQQELEDYSKESKAILRRKIAKHRALISMESRAREVMANEHFRMKREELDRINRQYYWNIYQRRLQTSGAFSIIFSSNNANQGNKNAKLLLCRSKGYHHWNP